MYIELNEKKQIIGLSEKPWNSRQISGTENIPLI